MKRILVISGIGSMIINIILLINGVEMPIYSRISVFAIIATMIMGLIVNKIESTVLIVPKREEKQKTFEIGHVADFLVGIDQIQDREYYYFYVREKDSYKLTRVPALDTEIIASRKAELQVTTTKYLKTICPGSLERLLRVKSTKVNDVRDENRKDSKVYKLYIPVGSIRIL